MRGFRHRYGATLVVFAHICPGRVSTRGGVDPGATSGISPAALGPSPGGSPSATAAGPIPRGPRSALVAVSERVGSSCDPAAAPRRTLCASAPFDLMRRQPNTLRPPRQWIRRAGVARGHASCVQPRLRVEGCEGRPTGIVRHREEDFCNGAQILPSRRNRRCLIKRKPRGRRTLQVPQRWADLAAAPEAGGKWHLDCNSVPHRFRASLRP